MMEKTGNRMNALKRGVIVFIILGVLTAIEYFMGVYESPSVLLWIVALVKAGLVLWYFMHLPRVFNPGGDH
jgi:heme/copper-type cytochrome/quinol oxidase subunit 4